MPANVYMQMTPNAQSNPFMAVNGEMYKGETYRVVSDRDYIPYRVSATSSNGFQERNRSNGRTIQRISV